jgi:hypothetical protein
MMFFAPDSLPRELSPSSGVGATSFVAVRGPDFATAVAFTSNFGRAIETAVGARFTSPAKRCSAVMIGAAVAGNGRLAALRLRRDIRSVSFGRGGCAAWFHCTMFGSAGRIFGASGGESG